MNIICPVTGRVAFDDYDPLDDRDRRCSECGGGWEEHLAESEDLDEREAVTPEAVES